MALSASGPVRSLGAVRVDDDDHPRRDARDGIETALAVDRDAPFGAQPARERPRDSGLFANDGGDGGLDCGLADRSHADSVTHAGGGCDAAYL